MDKIYKELEELSVLDDSLEVIQKIEDIATAVLVEVNVETIAPKINQIIKNLKGKVSTSSREWIKNRLFYTKL